MNLIAIQPLGRNREIHRLWIESQRLSRLGFMPGTLLAIRSQSGQLTLTPAILGENHVSSRQVPGGLRPIIDLANQSLLAGLASYSKVKIVASFERIQVSPYHRAFAIQRSRTLAPPFRVLEVFAGGGTMTAALTGKPPQGGHDVPGPGRACAPISDLPLPPSPGKDAFHRVQEDVRLRACLESSSGRDSPACRCPATSASRPKTPGSRNR